MLPKLISPDHWAAYRLKAVELLWIFLGTLGFQLLLTLYDALGADVPPFLTDPRAWLISLLGSCLRPAIGALLAAITKPS